MFSDKRFLILIGVLAFAITLAILTANRLTTEDAGMVAFAVAIGVAVGTGVGLILLRFGGGFRQEGADVSLTQDQADALFALLDNRQQVSADTFPLQASRNREFAEVGGAQLNDSQE